MITKKSISLAVSYASLLCFLSIGTLPQQVYALTKPTGSPSYPEEYVLEKQIGGPGFGQGELANPAAIAVDAVGNVYVGEDWLLDSQGHLVRWATVQVFSGAGESLRWFQVPGLEIISGMAVDSLRERIYLSGHAGEAVVVGLSLAGGRLLTIRDGIRWDVYGVAVNETSGDIYVVQTDLDTEHRIAKFRSTGQFRGELPDPPNSTAYYPTHIAFDQRSHTLLVLDDSVGGIHKFRNDTYETTLDVSQLPWAIAADAEGSMFVSFQPPWGTTKHIRKYAPDGIVRAEFGDVIDGADWDRGPEIAADQGSKLYLLDTRSPGCHCVQVFAPIKTEPVPRPIAPDAVTIGPFEVTSAEYRFPATVDPEILPDRETEIWARVYRPADLSGGPYPLVLFLHGDHGTCGWISPTLPARDDGGSNVWRNVFVGNEDSFYREYTFMGTCSGNPDDPSDDDEWVVVPNHEGYEYIAEPLASHGYIVVSVNTNRGINVGDSAVGDPLLILARGRMMLKHLELWHKWYSGTEDVPESLKVGTNGFKGKVDLSNVGLMGHSRGGKGVRAAYNLYRDPHLRWADGSAVPWRERIPGLVIKGIFEIAPLDSSDTSTTLDAEGTVWNVLLPMCDGDVRTLEGVQPFDRMMGAFGESPATQKSVYTVWGANHNFYNTEWKYSDSDGCIGHEQLFPDYLGQGGDLAEAQRMTALSSALAFFRGNVAASGSIEPRFNLNFNPMARIPDSVARVARIERGFTDSPNATVSTTLNDFTCYQDNSFSTGGGVEVSLTNVPNHWQCAAAVSWSSGGPETYFQANWIVPGGTTDMRLFSTLDFRISRQESEKNKSLFHTQDIPTNLSIRLAHVDGSLSSSIDLSDYAELLGPVGGPWSIFYGQRSGFHPILQTVRIPLRDFQLAKLDQVRGVRFTFDDTKSGAIFIRNIRASRLPADHPPIDERSTLGSSISWGPTEIASAVAGSFSIAEASVEIELTSADGFPVRDAPPVLRIGNKDFTFHRYKDATLGTLIFTLTQEEYAAIPDNATVQFLYGPYESEPVRSFGVIDKDQLDQSKLSLEEHLRPAKQTIVDELVALRSVLSDRQAVAHLDLATNHLRASIASELWRDPSRLNRWKGSAVFDEERAAAGALLQVVKTSDPAPQLKFMPTYLRRIVAIDKKIALLALDDVRASGRWEDRVATAEKEIAAGDAALLSDEYETAIEHYGRAWRVALPYVTYIPYVASGLPDLIGNISVSPNKHHFSAGEPVLLTATVTNQGAGAANPFWVDLFINPASPPTASNTIWSNVCGMTPCFGLAWLVPGLAPGQTVTLHSTPDSFAKGHTIWPGWFAAGTTDLYLYVDSYDLSSPYGAAAEMDESNNRAELRGLAVDGINPASIRAADTDDIPTRSEPIDR